MNTLFHSSKVRLIAALLASSVLAGCASFSADGGFNPVEKTTKERLGKDVKWARSGEDQNTIDSRVAELLNKPLSVDDAVQIALLNNKGLQAAFYELGISEADLVQAGRLPNPRFSMLRARLEDEYKIEQAFTFNIFSLITMPLAQKVEERRFAQTQRQVTSEVLRLAADTRKAYYTAISGQQTADYMGQVKDVAEQMRKHPEMEHDDPNQVQVDPGKTGQFIWKFANAGTFDFACLQPGHFEAGMAGKVAVK